MWVHSPGTTGLGPPDPRRPVHSRHPADLVHPRGSAVMGGRHDDALGAKVRFRVERQDSSKQKVGPWEMCNLRTPIIIIIIIALFFL